METVFSEKDSYEEDFNKIAIELRSKMKGQTIEQVSTSVTTLHGYLSSPTGGGVRHGVDLRSGSTQMKVAFSDRGRIICKEKRLAAGEHILARRIIADENVVGGLPGREQRRL